jgi:membrane protein
MLARALLAVTIAAVMRFRRHHGFVLAGALAFSFLLCLAPLTAVLLSVAGFLLEHDAIAERLFDAVVLIFPGYGADAARLVAVLVAERHVTGLIGTMGVAVFATQLIALARTIMNTAFDVRVRRGYVHGFVFDLAVVAAAGTAWTLLVGALIVLAAVGDGLQKVLGVGWLLSPAVRKLGLMAVTYAVGTATLIIVYRFFPNRPVPTRHAVGAALVAMTLWQIAGLAFGAYVARFGVYGKLYGSVGIGVAFLVWLYYSATLFVAGAELAAASTEAVPPRANPTCAARAYHAP